jgi:predicted RNase H-like HicB family nuclease
MDDTGLAMKLNVIVTRTEGEDVYVAQGVEVDIASQGATVEEALRNLEEAIELYFDDEDALPVPKPARDVELRQVDIPLAS